MLVSEKDNRTCEKYGTADELGFFHCFECPLRKGNSKQYDFRCKANSHYNRKTREWEYDDGNS